VADEKEQNEEKAKNHLDINIGEKSDDAENRKPEHLKEGVQVHDLLWNTA
jgi:hypothetical protein